VVERKRRKTKEAVKAEEVNWLNYFQRIRPVCPWSYKAFMREGIHIFEYQPNLFNVWRQTFHTRRQHGQPQPEAYVYTAEGYDSEYLENLTEQYNALDDGCEYLWSHPSHGGDSTPIPVIIQQDRATLTDLRLRVGYEEPEDLSYARTRFHDAKCKAKNRRGIEWELTFEEWYDWFLSHGVDRNVKRRYCKDSIVMCRKGDTGPYSLDNIYPGTLKQNSHDQHNMPKGTRPVITPHGEFRSCNQAGKTLGVSPVTVKHRCNSDNFPDWTWK